MSVSASGTLSARSRGVGAAFANASRNVSQRWESFRQNSIVSGITSGVSRFGRRVGTMMRDMGDDFGTAYNAAKENRRSRRLRRNVESNLDEILDVLAEKGFDVRRKDERSGGTGNDGHGENEGAGTDGNGPAPGNGNGGPEPAPAPVPPTGETNGSPAPNTNGPAQGTNDGQSAPGNDGGQPEPPANSGGVPANDGGQAGEPSEAGQPAGQADQPSGGNSVSTRLRDMADELANQSRDGVNGTLAFMFKTFAQYLDHPDDENSVSNLAKATEASAKSMQMIADARAKAAEEAVRQATGGGVPTNEGEASGPEPV